MIDEKKEPDGFRRGRILAGVLLASSMLAPVWRVAQAFDLAAITSALGAPFLRALCEGAGTTKACADGSTPGAGPALHSL